MRLVAVLSLLILVLPLAGVAPAGDAPICAACGQPIEGPVFQTRGLYYHAEHFTCAYCGKQIRGSYSEYGGKVYHNDCFQEHVALRCALCGEIIRGEYVQDYWGNSYCKRHDGEAPVCDSCGRFISQELTGGGVRYSDGRFLCNICRNETVDDIDEILSLVHDVAGVMKSFGMDVDYRGIKVDLVGRDHMQRLCGHHSDGLRGFTDYQEDFRVFGYAKNRRMHMYLLYGMPRMEIISTIAHELAHVWQFNHGRFKNERSWAEGSCNYASYRVLANYPGRESSFFRLSLSRDRDGVYGDGFRRVKTLVDAEGTKAWLRYLGTTEAFPPGY